MCAHCLILHYVIRYSNMMATFSKLIIEIDSLLMLYLKLSFSNGNNGLIVDLLNELIC